MTLTKAQKWKRFAELLKQIEITSKDPTLTYLHGILFGLDYPQDGVLLSSADQDQTMYYTVLFNTEKRKNLPLKDQFSKDPEGIDLVRFQTPDPEQAEFYLRKHCNIYILL